MCGTSFTGCEGCFCGPFESCLLARFGGAVWRCCTLDFVPFVQVVRFLDAGQWGVVSLVAVSAFRLAEWGALIFRRFKV